MDREFDTEMFDAALTCWDSGQDRDETTCKARERQGTRFFWKALGMRRPCFRAGTLEKFSRPAASAAGLPHTRPGMAGRP